MSIIEVPLGVYPVIAGKGVGVTVHAKVVPETFDESVSSVVWFPEQILCVAGRITEGLGFTVITCVEANPLHPPIEGVMV
jgi:hypothetical protein